MDDDLEINPRFLKFCNICGNYDRRGRLYTPHYTPATCIKRSSYKSHFHISLIVRQGRMTVSTNHKLSEDKWQSSPLLYHKFTARPNRPAAMKRLEFHLPYVVRGFCLLVLRSAIYKKITPKNGSTIGHKVSNTRWSCCEFWGFKMRETNKKTFKKLELLD